MKRLFLHGLASLTLVASATMPAIAQAGTVFMVQLGSFKTDDEAARHWSDLTEKFPDLFKPLKYAPTEVMLPPDDAVYHRTQAGPVATRDEADTICARVSSTGEECYVVETAMFEGAGTRSAADAAAPAGEPVVSADTGMQPAPQAATIPVAAPFAAETVPAAMPVAAPVVPVTATAMPTAAYVVPATASPAAPSRSPFGTGPSVPAGGAMASAPVAVDTGLAAPSIAHAPSPAVDTAAGENGDVHVAEAIPVPLSDPRLAGRQSPYSSGFRGTPSSYNRFMPFWAEIGYFDSQRGALGYWSVLRGRDPQIPSDLRLRITQPFQQRALSGKLSLRVGPFVSIEPIRRLCTLVRPERLGCRAVRDLGGSITYQPNDGANAARGAAQNPYRLRRAGVGLGAPGIAAPVPSRNASPFGGPTPPGGGFGSMERDGQPSWAQLGSFMTPQAAEDQWNDLKSTHYATLGRLREQVYVAGGIYRLRTGPFPRAEQAAAVCNALKRSGALCVVSTSR